MGEQTENIREIEQRHVHQIFSAAVKNRASDIHLRAGAPPSLRIDGELRPLKTPPVDGGDMHQIIRLICVFGNIPEPTIETKQLDFVIHLKDLGRFRCHLFRQLGTWAAAIRVVPESIPTAKDLRLPPVVNQIKQLDRGIVLVTGATGMGKSMLISTRP